MITAIVAINKTFDVSHWFPLLTKNLDLNIEDPEPVELLVDKLFTSVQQDLESIELEFEPLILDESEPLGSRCLALSDWCQGFVFGCSIAGLKSDSLLSKDIREAFADMTQISSTLDSVAVDITDEEEDTLIGVVEHVRVCVMLVHSTRFEKLI